MHEASMSETFQPLNEMQRAHLRETLDKRAADLRREIASGLHASERGDGSACEPEKSVLLAGMERDAQELCLISEALKRLGMRDFGACQRCGAQIPWARLRIQPHAEHCLACEGLLERRHPLPHASL